MPASQWILLNKAIHHVHDTTGPKWLGKYFRQQLLITGHFLNVKGELICEGSKRILRFER